MKPRVAIYCRVATLSQIDTEPQKMLLLQEGARLYPEAEFVVFSDIGPAAYGNNLPDYERMMRIEQAEPFLAVLAHSPSRISRSHDTVCNFEKLLEEYGTSLHYMVGDSVRRHLLQTLGGE